MLKIFGNVRFLAQNKEKCLAHREKCRNFAEKLQLDYL